MFMLHYRDPVYVQLQNDFQVQLLLFIAKECMNICDFHIIKDRCYRNSPIIQIIEHSIFYKPSYSFEVSDRF